MGWYPNQSLGSKLDEKVNRYELSSIRSNVDGLERTVGTLRAEIDELRRQCEELRQGQTRLEISMEDKDVIR